MDDVVKRLRAGLEAGAIDLADIMDAADEIERLRHGTAISDNCVAGNQPEIPRPVTEPMPKEKWAQVSDTELVAWAVVIPLAHGRYAVDDFFLSHSRAVEACDWRKKNTPRGAEIVPLYRQPQPALTDAEREAIEDAMAAYEADDRCADIAVTLRGLLERMVLRAKKNEVNDD